MTSRDDEVDHGRRGFLLGRSLRRDGRPRGPAPPCLPVSFDLCRDCAAPCVTACGPRIIRLHPKNHRLAGVPHLSFATGGCTFCGDCVDRCPVERTGPPPTRLGTAILANDACIAWNGTVCVSCRFACRVQAISVDARSRPSIDAAACTGCGDCVSVCPTDAIGVRG